MAVMIPRVRLEEIPHDSERVAYEALERLPNPYVVMHSYPWLRPGRGDAPALREGEADFIVLHPEHGMLVIEVKGGDPVLRGREWYRGRQPMQDPWEQARRSRYALLDAVEERTRRALRRDQFVHGDVVMFPHHTYSGALPHNTTPVVLIDAHGLQDLDERLQAAFRAWSRRTAPPGPAVFRDLQSALLPQLRLIRCVGADIDAEAARIVQLTADQQATLSGLLANRRGLIEGVAGSGKTLLALEFGVQVAERAEAALLLCYNRHLAAWLQERAALEPRLHGSRGSLEIDTFHGHAMRLARRAGVEFEVPSAKRDAARFWDEEAPMVLEQAIDVLQTAGEPVQYDAIIVDEGQDFFPDWWITVESLVRGGEDGAVYVFLDLHQSLRGEPRRPSIALPARFNLAVNCRNTRRIAMSAARVISADVRVLPGAPEGEDPRHLRATSSAAQAGIVLQELRSLLGPGRLQPGQIAVLGPAAHRTGSLARFSDVDGVPIVSDASAWRRGGGILVTTARSFKGLEADVVVLYDLSGFSELFTRADLYVAWTRAKHRLIAVCHGAEVRAQVEAALGGAP